MMQHAQFERRCDTFVRESELVSFSLDLNTLTGLFIPRLDHHEPKFYLRNPEV